MVGRVFFKIGVQVTYFLRLIKQIFPQKTNFPHDHKKKSHLKAALYAWSVGVGGLFSVSADLRSPSSFLHPLARGGFLVVVDDFPDIYASGPTFGIDAGAEAEHAGCHQLALQVIEANHGVLGG